MNGFKLWVEEVKGIAKNPKVCIPFIVLLFVPLIYGGMFLWANWDPYGSTEKLPVAVVNQDIGADFEGEHLEIGKDFVDNLLEDESFDYQIVTKEQAYAGIENQTYYMVFEIPENFSEHSTTILDEDPQKIEFTYVSNEGINFIIGKIGESASEQMKANLSNEISKTYADTIFEKFSEMQEGIAEASDKAGELDDGAIDLTNGAEELKRNLQTFAEKQIEFDDSTGKITAGIADLADGSEELDSGLSQLNAGFGEIITGATDAKKGTESLYQGLTNSGTGIEQIQSNFEKIVAKTDELQKGTEQLSTSLSEVNAGINGMHAGAQQLSQGLDQFEEALQPVLASLPEEQQKLIKEKLQALVSGSKELSTKTETLASVSNTIVQETDQLPSKVEQLIDGQHALLAGTNDLKAGNEKLQSGASELLDGEQQLLDGMHTFNTKLDDAKQGSEALVGGASELNSKTTAYADASQNLANSSQDLRDGATELKDGSTELKEGTSEFRNELTSSSKEANEFQPTENTEEMMSNPVEIKEQPYHHVPNYGTGLTPYFLSLGLFIGALLLTIIYDINKPTALPKTGFSWFMAKFGILGIAGVLQAVIVSTVILFGLDLEVNSIGLFYLFAIATSLTFVSMIQLLVTTMGNPGRFLAIVILIMQLTASGGTFPVELIPDALQPIHDWLPVTYTLEGFREIISIGDFSVMWHDLSHLTIYFVICILLTFVYFTIKLRKVHAVKDVDDVAV